MKRTLKILFAEDNADDLELVQYHLRATGLDIISRAVEKKADFIWAVQNFGADVIICDHSLPEFNSLEALDICRAGGSESVFILVTGTVSEEFAAQSIKRGADDYILKNNLVRLPSAINNALQRKEAERERKRGLELLAKSEKNYRHLFMHNPMPMWIVDTRTLRFRDVNQAAINHYGYGKREFLKMTVDDLQLDGSPLQSQYKKIGRTGAYSAGVTEHKKKDGSVIFVEITVDDLALGNSHESLVIAQDVTEKRRAMQQLEQQNNELLKINAELDRFVYSVSHELRSPITNMMGIVNELKDCEDPGERQFYINVLESCMGKQDRVIKEILSYSRNTRLEPELQPINFSGLVEEVIENVSYIPEVQMISIKTQVQENAKAIADKSRISVILNNLVHNAVVYHNLKQQDPFIKIDVEISREHIGILVRDNGIGISDKHQDRIFNMFYRASSAGEGSGLGLFMVREFTEKMGGKVKLHSALGKGTEIMVSIPNAGEARFMA